LDENGVPALWRKSLVKIDDIATFLVGYADLADTPQARRGLKIAGGDYDLPTEAELRTVVFGAWVIP
jgi:hypothetical protein